MFKVAALAVGALCAVALVGVAVWSMAGPTTATSADAATASAEPPASAQGAGAPEVRLKDVNGAVVGEWTDEHVSFFAGVIAKFEQAAFYASDGSFIDEIVAPESIRPVSAELASRVESQRWTLAEVEGPVWFVAAALAASVNQRTEDHVELAVWVHGVFNTTDAAHPEARYWIETATLERRDGKWLLVSLQAPQPAPQPMLPLDVEPSTASELTLQLSDFQLVSDPVLEVD